MSIIKQETIQRILDAAHIEEVIGEFVQLKKSGQSFKGLSPFQTEKTPSFYVVPSKQIFKDFSSGKGGNVVSFLMEHEKMTYPEALRWLAAKYNIEIEEAESGPEEKAAQDRRESIFIVNNYAQRRFQHLLTEEDEGKEIGMTYFKERGFLGSTIEKFGLGYCPDKNDTFSKQAITDGYQKDILIEAGLSKEGNYGLYDFYRARVIFPIHDFLGKVIGFAGRTLKSDQQAKYINTPESPVYHKSHVLYGIHLARTAIRKLDECLIVEGYTDVISLVQGGVEHVVASSGTAFTKEQIRLIRKLTENITILFDGDEAGLKAAKRSTDLILEEGMNVKVVILPPKEDPDSFMRIQGAAAFQAYIDDNKQDVVLYKIATYREEVLSDPAQKSSAVRDVVQTIAKIPDPIRRADYIRVCSLKMEVTEQLLHASVNKQVFEHIQQKKKTQATSTEPVDNQTDTAHTDAFNETREKDVFDTLEPDTHERELIRVMLEYGTRELNDQGERVIQHILEEVQSTDFTNKTYQSLFIELQQLAEQKEVDDYAAHLSRFGEDKTVNLVIDLVSDRHELSEGWLKRYHIVVPEKNYHFMKDIENTINRFKFNAIQRLIGVVDAQLKEEKDYNVSLKLLQKKKILDAHKRELGLLLGEISVPIIK